ncbi:glycosyl hydrolase family 18 protein [Flagellimonas myxillae]|uniref:glycosyl hydrolase family 18 protein n=1 Tax=Flagellimonas myxillae TaxID=2942214 RepID=UPI00201F132C|nr:glycosyl hydrolase family 18 protein [Muricauda myxillae]MCL6265860.1 glycosyl hydrolase family 18 protein [Muricauda myxillae]
MRKGILLCLILVSVLSCSKDVTVLPPEDEGNEPPKKITEARIVGYLPTYRFSLSSEIAYEKLTHLNLAFANPDADGNLIMPDISDVVGDARAANPNIVICLSLAGGALTDEQATHWSNLIDDGANIPGFVTKIVDYVLDNDLDGIDVDLEWSHVTPGYSPFVLALDTALDAQNKLLTVAFPQTRFANITDAALAAFDFINIMSYDATGPWNPANPGQHSSLQFSTDGINFWKTNQSISAERLNLGVPFYGYEFVSDTEATSFTFGQMVQQDVSYANLNQVGNAYYNGIPTIKAKVNLAHTEGLGGIMIWELGQDSFDEHSLLTAIHSEYSSLGVF